MAKRKYTPGDFKLAVRRSRTGLGLFALEAIPEGACIIEYTGKLLTDEEYNRSRSRYLFDIGKDKVLDGSMRTNRARYINHSCAPNCESDVHKKRPYIFAIRDIEAGEELAYDYGEEYFKEYLGENCLCLKCKPELAAKPAQIVEVPAEAPNQGREAA